jgi:hypothetical protein
MDSGLCGCRSPSSGTQPACRPPTPRNMPARGRVKRVYPRTSPRVRRTRNMSALKGNAVKHFLTRKMAYGRIVAEFVRIRNARKSSEFSRIRLRKCFTALPERAKQNLLGVCSALSGLCSFVDSQPGASLAAHAASLCPRLICSAPSGQCPSLHVNRRDFRKIRSRALPPDEPQFGPTTEQVAFRHAARPQTA